MLPVTMTSPTDRISQLRALLERASHAYYQGEEPLLSDIDFDRLLAELTDLEAAHPELADPNSIARRVGGGPIKGFRTLAHARPMLSIDNTYHLDHQDHRGLADWHARVLKDLPGTPTGGLFAGAAQPPTLVADAKIDGLAISLRYEKGELAYALTRGDGAKGDDVTHNIRTIRSIPLRLADAASAPAVLEVRGEVYFPLEEFARINREREAAGEELFMNPRNAAAGTLKQLDPGVTASRKLAFAAHGRGEISDADFADSHSAFLERLDALGLPVNTPLCRSADLGEVVRAIQAFGAVRHQQPYAIDGVVVRVDRWALQDALGSTAKSPRWIVAYKFPAERKTTRLLRVDHQVGKSGKITPRAVMEPVLLAGTVVQHATLHNYGRILDASTDPDNPQAPRTDIRLGDEVFIEKAGEIIPYVAGVHLPGRRKDAAPIVAPTTCPECGGTVEAEPPESLGQPSEAVRRCVNPECPAQVREKLIWFAGRKQMDIDGLGEKTIDQIRASGDIPLNTFADIFRLGRYRERLTQLDRMGEKKVDNLLAGIEAAKSRGLAKVLGAMGIRHVGDATARMLARQFADLDALLAAEEPQLRPKSCTKEEAAQFGLAAKAADRPETGLGEGTAETVYQYLHSAAARRTFDALREEGVSLVSLDYRPPGTPEARADNPFADKTMVITGALSSYEREALAEVLMALGAKVTGSVSSKTDVVIVGDNAGSKLDKARSLNITIWDEAALLKNLRDAGVAVPDNPPAAS
jgi:DNA ligase (NAD+)